MNIRQGKRTRSNNPHNPNKNICVLRVAEHLKVHNETRYLHNVSDLVMASRKLYKVRSRESQVRGKSVGGARAKLAKLANEVNAIGFIMQVDGHVLFLNSEGTTIVDSAPRKRDKRKIRSCYVVYNEVT